MPAMTNRLMRFLPVVLLLPLAGAASACRARAPDLPQVEPAAYADTIAGFHQLRIDMIAGPDGWTTLLGLWWLAPGENRIGSDTTLEIVLPAARSPKRFGAVTVAADSVRFVAARGVKIVSDGHVVVAPLVLHDDIEGDGKQQTVLRFGSLTVAYITRGGKKAVRIKDSLAVARTAFPGHRYFPTDTAWRVTARFVARPTVDSMDIINVLGIQTRMSWPGELRFRFRGAEYSLQVVREPEDHGKRLFVMFRDSTNLTETYPAMRYTFVNPPDSLGRTALDFNQAYTPPCAYTSAATCPLPPKGNTLPFRVPAGELKPAVH